MDIIFKAEVMAEIEGNSGLFFVKKMLGNEAEFETEENSVNIKADNKKFTINEIGKTHKLDVSYVENENVIYKESNVDVSNIVFTLKKISKKIAS